MRPVILAIAIAFAGAAGCSSQAPSSQPSGANGRTSAPPSTGSHSDAGAGDASPSASAGSPDASADPDANRDDGHLCVLLANSGPSVREKRVADDPPNPTGGTISPGTYELVAYTTYTGAGGATGQTSHTYVETMMFDGTDWERVLQSGDARDASHSPPYASSGTYSAEGSTLSITLTCPTYGGSSSLTYSVLGPELHIVSDTVERVFSLQ
jgi:hypothetical protein